jgi:hypothetical protein
VMSDFFAWELSAMLFIVSEKTLGLGCFQRCNDELTLVSWLLEGDLDWL